MSQTTIYKVQGMTCAHCVTSVTEEVQDVPGVAAVEVVLETGVLRMTSDETVDDTAIKAAVEEAGYQLA